jgi:hypothetical protein
MKTTDPLTKEVFTKKRNNQKFASAQNRIKYNNSRAAELRNSVKPYNSGLQTNLKILNEIMKGKTDSTFHEEFLKGKGFNFKLITHVTEFEKNQVFAVYNFGVFKTGITTVRIIKLPKND